MSVTSPGRSGEPEWGKESTLKPQAHRMGVEDKIKPTEEQLPEGSPKTPHRTITNKAPQSATEPRIQRAAVPILPKLSEHDVMKSLIWTRVLDTITELGVKADFVADAPDSATLDKYNIYHNDPLRAVKVKLLTALEANDQISKGRKLLLKEMIIKPEQVLLDLPRFPTVRIGDITINQQDVPEQESIAEISKLIAAHVESKNPTLVQAVYDKRDELLYATSQTFFESLSKKQSKDIRFKDIKGNPLWEKANTSKAINITSFEMEKTYVLKPTTLIITRSKEIPYVPITGEEGEKRLTMTVECRYNLKSSDVVFNATYELDGKKETWQL